MPVKDHGSINQTVSDLVSAVNGEAGTGVAAAALGGANLAVQSITVSPSGPYVPILPFGNVALKPAVADGAIFVSGLGSDANDGVMMGEGFATLSKALTTMGTTRKGIIWLGLGTFDVLNGLSLSGYHCSIQGVGAGSIVTASTQTGPVLDLSGWLGALGVGQRQKWGGFSIVGSGVGTATLHGMRMGSTGVNATNFEDIVISNTGGVPLYLEGGCELTDFSRILLCQPISANANNIPYLKCVGPVNGVRFIGVGLLNPNVSNPDAVGGSIVLVDDAVNQSTLTMFYSCWSESLRIPNGGTMISCKGTQIRFVDFQSFDQQKVGGATGTSFVLFPATFNGVAGNVWDGTVPAHGSATDLDFGIITQQSGLVVKGLRGYSILAGSHVRLDSGVGHCYIDLQGTPLDSTQSGITDNSGTTTNRIHDRDVVVQAAPLTIKDLLSVSTGTTCVLFAGTEAGGSPPTPTAAGSNSTRGEILFGTGTAPTAGRMVDVYGVATTATFPVVTATNDATAALGLYVSGRAADHFTVSAHNAPAASQATGTYKFLFVNVA
jgi:hypothetical protein